MRQLTVRRVRSGSKREPNPDGALPIADMPGEGFKRAHSYPQTGSSGPSLSALRHRPQATAAATNSRIGAPAGTRLYSEGSKWLRRTLQKAVRQGMPPKPHRSPAPRHPERGSCVVSAVSLRAPSDWHVRPMNRQGGLRVRTVSQRSMTGISRFHQNYVRALGHGQLAALLAVVSRENLEIAASFKARLQHVEVIVIVFDVEHFGGQRCRFPSRLTALLVTLCSAHFFRSLHGEAHREHRALAGLALHRDVPAHHLAEAFADREAEASSAVFPRR
jgi:hypothetical protein